ncbi:MAG: hypothetical protein QOH42_2554, partial [Blastocatellia bacterium]|nr:hypothetical protein [Blastocatellia bacterium]
MFSVKFLSPLRGSHFLPESKPGLTPWAIVCRPRCGLVEGPLLGSLFVMVILLASFSSVWAQSSDAPFP